ncbi:M13 family metallopeptidase [Marivirga arenosa]|uniref:M13 family metallopeptidase n=1 Tax=Marivirga arenosa TaxID=3059076 RepID=A0AA49GET8_9BACT|nr:M13 family metallopeptidase [Marivirga sp. ABR2-2]WKK86519.2 M13 family metallopeptidase [Marivirga sp. ABR2-2]
MKKILTLSIAVLIVFACNSPSEKSEQTQKIIKIEGIDSTMNPGDNFFRYVNGIWYDSATIPETQAGVGAYRFMNYPQRLRLQNLLDSVSQTKNAEGSIEQMVGDFYASGMDMESINQKGYEPIKPILFKVESIIDVPSLMNFVAEQSKMYNNTIVGFYVGPDDKNSKINIAHAYQTGLGLPNRDYYFENNSSTLGIQKAYKEYVTTLFELSGLDEDEAKAFAKTVYEVEKNLAESHRTRVELRDVKANYNKMAVASLDEMHHNIAWSNLLNKMGASTDSIDVGQPEYYNKLNELLGSISIEDWKLYLKATTMRNYAAHLSKDFVDAEFAFTKVISGQAIQKTRGEKMASEVDNLLGEALGQLYVKKYFPESAKERMLVLLENAQKAYSNRIDNLEWMTDSTKVKAKEKLFSITKKIGYPDEWREYGQVKVKRNDYFANILSASKADYEYNLAKLGQPVNKKEWYTTPSTVTAYYNPSANEIVFPAGILQPPYFDYEADDALNYGGIGMVIGHELTHSFDDQGAQFDKEGNVNNWWTKEDYEKFRAKTQDVIDLYSSFTVLDTLHINGAMTVGENTADLSGLAVAYDAFKLTKQGQDTAKIDGFTPDQRFFMSLARIWRVKMKEEYLRLWIKTNSHSPPMWRVNGPLMNTPAFYSAFDIKEGDEMYLAEEERVAVW